MESAMRCKVQGLRRGAACGENKSNTRRSRYACIVEAHESTRQRLDKLNQKIMKIALLGRDSTHWVITILRTSSFSSPEHWKDKMQKPLWTKNGSSSKKCQHGKWPESGVKKVIKEAEKVGRTVQSAALMDISHIKNFELEPKFLKYKGRVVLRVTLWKTILALTLYLRSTVRQHHKWRPQKLWMSLQGNQDAQDKQQTQSQLTPKSNGRRFNIAETSPVRMSRYLDTSTTTRVANIMVHHWRTGCSSWAKLKWSSVGRTIMGRAIREGSISIRLGKSSKLGMFIRFTETKKDYSCQYTWMTWKMAGRKQDFNPLWKKSMKLVDLRTCEDMRGHCELANKTIEQLCKVSTPCLDDHLIKKRIGNGIVKSLLSNRPEFLYLARIDRPDIPWPVHKLARAVTKWTRACDRHLARLISHIHSTSDYRQYCHVGNTAQHCRFGLSACWTCVMSWHSFVAQLVTSQLVTADLTLTCFSYTDVLGPSRITRKQLASSIVHSALLHFFHTQNAR